MKKKKIIELTTKEFDNTVTTQIRKEVDTFYQKKILKMIIINRETRIKIEFNSAGRKKTLQYLTPEKAVVIQNLIPLLREAELIGVEIPKKKHQAEKALIFLITCIIDDKLVKYRVIVMKKHNGLFQYDLYNNEIKEDKTR